MNNYSGKVRNRCQNLLIVEGNHEKNKLFQLLFRCFPEMKISIDDIWIYGTNIYMLYNNIVSEYGDNWDEDDVDLPFVISKKQGMNNLRYKADFINIILVFDYERHDPNFTVDKIIRMQKYFMDATDVGRLYINYPMIESYLHIQSMSDEEYLERKIPASLKSGREYKAIVRTESSINKLVEFTYKVEKLLKDYYEITKDDTRRCCESIFGITSENDLAIQIHSILDGNINEKDMIEAKHRFTRMIKNMNYASSGQTYYQYMRDVFKQIIRHNILKAVRIQTDEIPKDKEKYREYYECIDLAKILDIQNSVSRENETGFIWVLCTCVFVIPEYNSSLIVG